MPARNAILFLIIGCVLSSYILFFRAIHFTRDINDPVQVYTTDIIPLLLMTITLLFVPRWESGGVSQHGHSSAFQGFRRGGICDPSMVRVSIGAILFFTGFIWQVMTIADRWAYPISSRPTPRSYVAAIYLLFELFLMSVALFSAYLYTTVMANPRTTLIDALVPANDEE